MFVVPLADGWRSCRGASVSVSGSRESGLQNASAVGVWRLRGSFDAMDAEHGT